MTDFDSNRQRLAELLQEMRQKCPDHRFPLHWVEDTDGSRWVPQPSCVTCQSLGYIPLPISGDGTRSWMGILTETMGFKHHWWAGWDYTKNGFLCELSSKDGVVTATSFNADEALAAAAVAALKARHGGV